MVKKLIIYVSLLLTVHSAAFTQTQKDAWFDAEITLLAGGRTIKGLASYDLRLAKVRVKDSLTTHIYLASQIEKMALKQGDRQHYFERVEMVSTPYELSNELLELIYKSPENYSVYKEHYALTTSEVNNGSHTFVLKLAPNANKDAFVSEDNKLNNRRQYDYLMINKMGESISLNRRNVLRTYSDKVQEIKKYVKKKRFGFKKATDLISIFKYYDALTK